jgi:hypothetical protein
MMTPSHFNPDDQNVFLGTFELLGINLTYEGLQAIMDGFHTSRKDELCQEPLTDFGYRPDSSEVDSENVKWLVLEGVWQDAFSSDPADWSRQFVIAQLQFVKTGKGRANIIGIRYLQTPDGAEVFDQLWAHIAKSVGYVSKKADDEPILPIKPKDKSNLFLWFDYKHAMSQAGFKYTLKELAKDVNLSYEHVRHEHMGYKAEKGLK